MNKRQKEVIKYLFGTEKATLSKIEYYYRAALMNINDRIKLLQADEMTQSRIYQVQYQKLLKAQIDAVLDKLHSQEYQTIDDYMHSAYTDGFVGEMYDLHGQQIPVIAPIDRKAMLNAVLTDSQISEKLYKELGQDIGTLKTTIRREVTRGVASNMSWMDIATQIRIASGIPMRRAKTIAETEGARVQSEAADDARQAAKSAGADIVKQWHSLMFGKHRRENHKAMDGEIVGVDERFSNGLKYPCESGAPAGEVIKCQCKALTRSVTALDEDEYNRLKTRAESVGLKGNYRDFEDFKKKYLKAMESLEKSGKSGIIKLDLQRFAEKDIAKQKSLSLKKAITSYSVKVDEHNRKLDNPQDYCEGWNEMDSRQRDGLKKHWEKEIRNFQRSIQDRIDELKKRGDYDDR